jgi:hypothetical protein
MGTHIYWRIKGAPPAASWLPKIHFFRNTNLDLIRYYSIESVFRQNASPISGAPPIHDEDRTHAQAHGQIGGGAIQRPFLRLSTIFLLLSAAFILIMPEIANAQVWVSSGFIPDTTGNSVTGYCSTSAVDPKTGVTSPAATDYPPEFGALCYVTTSAGATITFPNCPIPPSGSPADYFWFTGEDNNQVMPTARCSLDFPTQPGVTYTIHSVHRMGMDMTATPAVESCNDSNSIGGNNSCYADPEGYLLDSPDPFRFPQAGYQTFPFSGEPYYSTSSSSITVEQPGSVTGTGVSQTLLLNWDFILSQVGNAPYFPINLATASAQYTPCSKPAITSLLPKTWFAGESYNVTITGTGFTTSANATASCPVNTVTVTTPSGAVVGVSIVSVVSATQITASVVPPVGEVNETATITVSGTPAATTTVDIVGCFIPTTETTAFQGWDTAESQPTVGLWEQTVSDTNGDSFSGATVQEVDAGGGVDTCYFYDPNLPNNAPMTSITGGSWTNGDNNTWGPDKVGYTAAGVAYYRANKKVPCGFTVYQQMQIQCADGNWYNYGNVNTLQGNITATTVTSKRAGGTATRRY